jgi:pimeloyl-ACP methyl ester carboxylesterase
MCVRWCRPNGWPGYARGEPVLDKDARAMALAHGRLLVAGPGRDPSTLDADVWAAAMDMATRVFHRMWSGPPAVEEVPDPPGVARLAEVRAPTLVVNGLSDAPWLQDLSAHIASTVPSARRVDLPDTGHLPPLERPVESTRLIASFAAN